VRSKWQSIARISYELQDAEEAAGLSVHRPPDPTFIAVAYAWAAGEGFADVVAAEELSGGDFVRTMKQLIDLLRQFALVAPLKETRRAADAAAEALFRGVVASSSAVEVADPENAAEPGVAELEVDVP
jgi:ATP-dependent RNA helicase HelY